MRIALLGLSHPHSGILLATLAGLPEITEICLWDADDAVVARQLATARPKVIQITSEIDCVLSQTDLVFALVCVRHDQMASVAGAVLAAGHHLLVEKPAGLNAAEIARLADRAQAAGRQATVLYPRRLHPCVLAARDWVAGGRIGPLLTIEGRFLATQVRFRDPASWLFRRPLAGGGILLWLGCHVLDLIHHISGDEIVEVGARFAIRSGEAIEVEDCAALSLRFASGTIGTFHAGYTLAFSGAGYLNRAGYDSYLGFNGRAGRVVWPDLNPRLYVEAAPTGPDQPAGREETFTLPESPAYGGSFGETFFRQFIAATRGQGTAPTDLTDALRTARVIEPAEESARTGRFIRVAT